MADDQNDNGDNLQYDENSVTVLKGLEAVRRRPGMYVGGTDFKALHHLVYEVVDNSIDEALAGTCTEIAVIIYKNGAVTVSDNGRGIPVGPHPTEKISTLQVVMTQLNAGGKFGGGGYKVSGGLHGVGVSAVNALSQGMQAEVIRNGYLWRQQYERGIPVSEVEKVEKVEGSGTAIYFQPDSEIFPDTNFRFETLANRFREMAFVTRGVTIHLRDERVEPFPREMSFYFEGGISSFVRYLNRNRKPTHDVIYGSQVFELTEPNPARIEIEIALQYADYYSESTLAFANTIHTPDGGTHLEGLRAAVTRAINYYAKKSGVLKENDPSFTGEDTYEGLTAIVSIKHPEPQFESQTKVKLLNPEVKGLVQTLVNQAFGEFLQTNPRGAKAIYEKCLISSRARTASKRARELIRSSPLQSTTLPGKLADCSSPDPMQSELYIVEGDSAGGSAKQGRDRHFQAILPLRGKILNTERARLDKILDNKEVQALISALGVGVGDDFDLSRLRYGRIIIMTDADVDGAHIRTLLLTFFFRYMPDLIKEGHLYIAQPPLFLLKSNKRQMYAYTDEQKDNIIIEWGGKADIQRYKGLGEMNPNQLWETTMDPSVRTLLQVTIEDAAAADRTFDMLMGSNVPPRRTFITTHARSVRNLDV
ncbi:MAG: DNA topoisomerase (ATP-hydrolyzing) subunit B [Anaerolineae bacterium]|nr:DNA topoisomerase (ATP-hydrolyzing) subunit B [Anaerolineae bacterium]